MISFPKELNPMKMQYFLQKQELPLSQKEDRE